MYGEEDRERNNKGYCKTTFVLKEVVDLGLKVGNTLWKLLFTESLSNGLRIVLKLCHIASIFLTKRFREIGKTTYLYILVYFL